VIGCADFLSEIGSLLDGDVAAELRARLEDHLAHCQTCQVVYDSTQKTLRIITDSGSFDLSDAAFQPIAERVMARIRESKP
jgi:predicted anti-sigma-YlaC factor YlaD